MRDHSQGCPSSSPSTRDQTELRFPTDFERPVGVRAGHDPIAQRQRSLDLPTSVGAVAVAPVLTLAQLRQIIESDKKCTVAISDVHGYAQLLTSVLEELGIVSHGERVNSKVRLISMGDLVDGRSPTDFECARIGEKFFDEIVAGNHEAAILGGPSIQSVPKFQTPELTDSLWRMCRSGKLKAATTVDDILLTHAGVSRYFAEDLSDPAELASALNSSWSEFLGRPSLRAEELFQIGFERLDPTVRTILSPGSGGALWEDWSSLLKSHPERLRQMVGHSSRGRPEKSTDGLLHNIDLAGYRLGIAVVLQSGEVVVGTDYFPS